MERGDIDNRPTPVIYLIFEGLLIVPKTGTPLRKILPGGLRTHSRESAVKWRDNPHMFEPLWRLARTGSYSVRFVSFLHPGDPVTRKLIKRHIEEGPWPYADIEITTPSEFARKLAWAQHVAAVVDSAQDRLLMWGSHAVHCDPGHPATALSPFYR